MFTGIKNVVKKIPLFRDLIQTHRELQRRLFELQRENAELRERNDSLEPLKAWGRPCYCDDGMCNYGKNMSFMQEENFKRAYQAALNTGSKNHRPEDIHIEWRIHIILWAGRHALHLPGDFVECGVNRGFCSAALCDYLEFNKTGKSFYLFDTYNGIPLDQLLPSELEHARENNELLFEECYEIAKHNFSSYPKVHLIRGQVPDTLGSVPINKVCYLSIDMNNVVPEVAAFEYFWDKLVPGAIVVLDDYGWAGYDEQKNGLDSLAARKGVTIATLPTGQGLLVKP